MSAIAVQLLGMAGIAVVSIVGTIVAVYKDEISSFLWARTRFQYL